MQDDSYIATVQEGSGEDANHNNDKNAGDRRGQRSSRKEQIQDDGSASI